jgi:CspA family cold shock protein
LVGVSFDELREGDAVSFETEDSPKGMNAINVQKA